MNDKISNLIRLFEAVIDPLTDKKIALLLFSVVNITIACMVLFLKNLDAGAWLLGIFMIIDAFLLGMAYDL